VINGLQPPRKGVLARDLAGALKVSNEERGEVDDPRNGSWDFSWDTLKNPPFIIISR
jgi:hypothetical protein